MRTIKAEGRVHGPRRRSERRQRHARLGHTDRLQRRALRAGARVFQRAALGGHIHTGDNDWTDCDRSSNGSFSSRERLDHEGQRFFSTEFSLGQSPIKQEVQTDKLRLDHFNQLVGSVENRRWTMNSVVYATLNIQGSCNNLCDTLPGPAEWAQDFLVALRDQVIAFRKPGSYLHGDSHYFRIDRPFQNSQG